MKEYEHRRATFYGIHGHESFDDEHENFDFTIEKETVVEDAVRYLTDGTSYLRFPGAARAVAIAAADFVSREFGEDFYQTLNQPYLMHNNDPFFRTYTEDKQTYDAILALIPRDKIVWDSERMAITHNILIEEYMLDDDGLKVLPRS